MVAVGCEPRLDYSACAPRYQAACPLFYLVFLLLQGTVFLCSSYALLRRWLRVLLRPRAPHEPRTWNASLGVCLGNLGRDTVLQMELGTAAYSLAAVVHHAALLQPKPLLPHLLVEYCYNIYNTFLVATIATTLRYWQEFSGKAAASSGLLPPGGGRLDTALGFLWSWQGCRIFVLVTMCFCLLTDTWALLSNDLARWHRAVLMQHFFFMGVCFVIAMSNLRIGYVQERFVARSLYVAMVSVVSDDEQIAREIWLYKVCFRLVVLGNGLLWIACFNACGVGGVLFETFYRLAFWMLLFGLFNVVGLLFAAICCALALPVTREAELRLHDLLAYTLAAKRAASRRAATTCVLLPQKTHSELSWGSPCCPPELRKARSELIIECLSTPYPCYVMSLHNLRRYSRLPEHEDALRDGTLQVLTQTSYWPCRSYSYFVSQVWLGAEHPDGPPELGNPKLRWLQEVAPEILGGEHMVEDVFLWMDIFSIPQRSPEYTRLGISALPSYAALAGGFIPLVEGPSNKGHYQRRGWCMLECICALTPKLTQRGYWRMGPHASALRYFYFGACGTADDSHPGLTLETLHDPQDPAETDFTVEADRATVRRVQHLMVRLMELYVRSGSECWDHTCNLRHRPEWLRASFGDSPSNLFTPMSLLRENTPGESRPSTAPTTTIVDEEAPDESPQPAPPEFTEYSDLVCHPSRCKPMRQAAREAVESCPQVCIPLCKGPPQVCLPLCAGVVSPASPEMHVSLEEEYREGALLGPEQGELSVELEPSAVDPGRDSFENLEGSWSTCPQSEHRLTQSWTI